MRLVMGAIVVFVSFLSTMPVEAQIVELEACDAPAVVIDTVSTTVEFTEDLEIGDTRVFTDITHPFIGDLVTFLTSPSGTTIVLFADPEGVLDGDDILLTWSDDGIPHGPPFDCDCLMQPFQPLLSNFDCEGALGIWTLDLFDVFAASDEGTLNEWCVTVGTQAPAIACATPGDSFGGIGFPSSIMDTLEFAEVRFAEGIEISAEITHASPNEMVVSVTSPAGATVTLHESDLDAAPGITLTWSDAGVANAPPFSCFCLMEPAGPGTMADLALAAAEGEWSLEIVDSVAASTPGTLNEWCVRVYGDLTPRKPDTEQCSAPATEFGVDPLPASVTDTIAIADELPGFFDVEVSTDVTHSFVGDLSITVTSPAATAVTLLEASDIADDDDVLATWSDRGEAHGPPFACDRILRPADPAGLKGLVGKSIVGDWTLTVADAFVFSDSGTLNDWCLLGFADTSAPPEAQFLRGDADGNGTVQALLDALALLNWQFNGGAEPPCFDAADVDGNDLVSALLDALFLLNWQFNGGAVPPAPGTEVCGPDPGADAAQGCATPAAVCSP